LRVVETRWSSRGN